MKTTIAIKNQNHETFAIDAELVTVAGIDLAIHRNCKGNGWAATFAPKGIALAVTTGGTRAAVVELARTRIERAGVDAVKTKLSALPDVAPIEGLPRWSPPVKPTKAKVDVETIVDCIRRAAGLSDAETAAVRRALNRHTGQLKAKAPSAFGDADEQLAAAAWQGLQPNGFKVGIVSVFSLRGAARELYDKLAAKQWPGALDKDRAALEALGVW